MFGRESSTYRGDLHLHKQTMHQHLRSNISNSITSISILRSISINITESVRKTRIFRLALNTMTLQVTSVNVNSGQGVAISVTGIAQVNFRMTIVVAKVVNCK